MFLTTANEAEEVQYVVAYDLLDGRKLWQTEIHRGKFSRRHEKNSHASPTLAGDGEKVYALFHHGDGLYVSAVNLDGSLAWQTKAGDYQVRHGAGASPAIHDSLVIVAGESKHDPFLAGLHRGTGDVVWKKTLRAEGWSFASPVVANVAGRSQLLLASKHTVGSYDPNNGQLIWQCRWPAVRVANSVVCNLDRVFACSTRYDPSILCVRADGTGDVSDTHVLWQGSRGASYVPSPILNEKLLYIVSDDGVFTAFESETGHQVYRQRLSGKFSASPLVAGDCIYMSNERGVTYVVKTGRTFELIAQNDLGEPIFASPVVCNGRLLLRTERSLYCIGPDE